MKNMCLGILFLLLLAAGAAEYKFEVKSDRHWKLKTGETAVFSARLLARENLKAPFKAVSGHKVKFMYRENGILKKQMFFNSGEKPFVYKAKMDRPGWIMLTFDLYTADGKKKLTFKDFKGKTKNASGGIGALVEPEKLAVGVEEPADFDAFWQSQKALLKKHPAKASLKPLKVPDAHKQRIRAWEVKIPCPGVPGVSAYMSIPLNAKPKSLPAIVFFHAAGIRSCTIPVGHQAIQFNLNGQPRSYYTRLWNKDLKGYFRMGKESREKIYFRGMFLRIMRALEYVKSLPEWDGKILIVTGTSMGGGQSIAAAGLDPQVSLVVANVPALGDHGGNLAKDPRSPGWPQFYYARTAKPEVVKAAGYYDNIFFARRIKCEVYLTTGLIDGTCPPTSVWLFYENLKSTKKSIQVFPNHGHMDVPSPQGWKRMNELLKGKK